MGVQRSRATILTLVNIHGHDTGIFDSHNNLVFTLTLHRTIVTQLMETEELHLRGTTEHFCRFRLIVNFLH